MNRISAETLHGWITDGQELALLDAREDGEFGDLAPVLGGPVRLGAEGNPGPGAAAAADGAGVLRR